LVTARPALAIDVMNTDDPIAELVQHIAQNPTSEDLKNPNSPWYSIGVIVKPDTTYVQERGTVELIGVSRHDVAAFTGDLLNDVLWYPGVIDTTLVEGHGQVGSVYEETLSALGITYTNQIYIAGRSDDHYQIENSIHGLVPSIGVLVWESTPAGSRLTLHGLVAVPPGVDPTLLSFYLNLNLRAAFTNLLDFFGTTGTVNCTERVVTTPDF